MRSGLLVIRDAPLPYSLSLPRDREEQERPVLCFLHGLGEGPPTDIVAGTAAHGPLRPGSSPLACTDFVVAAPQLPARGDIWRSYADAVVEIVRSVQDRYRGDPDRTYLTGFSFGGNGVLDLAVRYPRVWAALWPVDPTRVPESDPGLPVWLSAGEATRPGSTRFIERLSLEPPGEQPGRRVFLDHGLDHVATATVAYRSDRVYRWLLSIHRDSSPLPGR